MKQRELRGGHHRWLWVLAFGLYTYICALSSAFGTDALEKLCIKHYRSGKLLKAADCFVAIAKELSRRGSSRSRIMSGRALRNASSVLARLARQAKRPARAMWLRERAAALLSRYLKDKLYELKEHRYHVMLQLAKLKRSIVYSHLTVVAPNNSSKIAIQGFQLKAQGIGRWSQRVRPGTYTVIHEYPGGKRRRQVSISAGKSEVVVFKLQRVPGMRVDRARVTWSWVLLAVGGGMLLSGGIILLVGEGFDQAKVDQNLKLLADRQMTLAERRQKVSEVRSLQEQSQALYIAGWSIVGVSALAFVGAGLVRWLHLPKRKVGVKAPPVVRAAGRTLLHLAQ